LSGIWQELSIAARVLARSRGFAIAVIGTLGIAIALQTSMIAVVNAYLVRGLPYPDADRLYSVVYAEPAQPQPSGLSSLDWASLSDVIEHPIAWDLDVFYMLGGEYPEGAPGAWVTDGFTRGLGLRVSYGRTLMADDFAPGAPQVALIAHDLWLGRFGGDSAVIGREVAAYVSDRPEDPEAFTIVGVLPARFWHLNTYTQVLTPLRAPTYPYLVRLRAGVSPDEAERRIESLVREGVASVPDGWRISLRPVHAQYADAAKPMLLAVGAAVTLVFFVACANVALLMVLRGLRRRKEIAVRLALGAGVPRVARYLLAESLLLVGAAATLGVALAGVALRALAPTIEQQLGRRVPGGVSAIAIDWTVLGIVGAAVLILAIALSVVPFTGSGSLSSALRAVRGGVAGRRRTRSALVTLEVAGSLALLVGSGLMIRTVVGMLDVDLGIRTERIISTVVAVRENSYPDGASRVALYERLVDAVRGTDGIASMALASPSPLNAYQPQPVQTDDAAAEASSLSASVRVVTSGYFEVLGVALVRGRTFADSDRGTSEPVAILSASAARRLWPRADPIGRTIRLVEELPNDDTITVVRTVVGVARDVRQSPTDEDLADLYVPLLQAPGRFVAIVARTEGRAPSWLTVLRRTVRDVDPELAMGAVAELDVVASEQLSRPRFLAALFSAFGIFAAALGAVGLYAVIAYAVRQREHEIAVRMAVGAGTRQIVNLFLRDGAAVVLTGVALGLAGAVAAGRVLESQLFGVHRADVLTLAAASITLLVLSLAAIWWPAHRASRIDPVNALKGE
jgi:putative ABC transport system permease protein